MEPGSFFLKRTNFLSGIIDQDRNKDQLTEFEFWISDTLLQSAKRTSNLNKRENKRISVVRTRLTEIAITLSKHLADLLSGVSRGTVEKLKGYIRSGNVKGGLKILRQIGKIVIRNRNKLSEKKSRGKKDKKTKAPKTEPSEN